MNMEAAGAYIRAVRDEREMSRSDVARISDVHESQISRIEAGTQDAGYVSVFAVVRAIRGSALDIQRLLSNRRATVEQAQQMAKDFVRRTPTLTVDDPDLDRVLAVEYDYQHDDGSGAERVRAAHIIDALLDDLDTLNEWLRYGEYLAGHDR